MTTGKSVLGGPGRRCFGDDLNGRTFALWGLAFKPNTDDMREAPSRVIIAELVRRGARIQAYDPGGDDRSASRAATRLRGKLSADQKAALQGADALLVVTEWKEFRNPDFAFIKSTLKQALILDGRNIYDPALVQAFGIRYIGIGRGGAAAIPAVVRR